MVCSLSVCPRWGTNLAMLLERLWGPPLVVVVVVVFVVVVVVVIVVVIVFLVLVALSLLLCFLSPIARALLDPQPSHSNSGERASWSLSPWCVSGVPCLCPAALTNSVMSEVLVKWFTQVEPAKPLCRSLSRAAAPGTTADLIQ